MLWLCSLRRNTEPPLSSSSLHAWRYLGEITSHRFQISMVQCVTIQQGDGEKVQNKGPSKKVPLKQSHAALGTSLICVAQA